MLTSQFVMAKADSNSSKPSAMNMNVWMLVAAQALGGASPPIIIALGGLVGQSLTSDPVLSTLPVSLYQLGVALSTIPAAIIMRRLGRRAGYIVGALAGVLSGLLAAWGIVNGSFIDFCMGTALAGFYGACVQSYRFAAADAVEARDRPRAISLIMVGGLIAAIIGPQVVIWTRDAMPDTPFAGSFISQAALALLALPIIAFLRMPAPAKNQQSDSGRPLKEIALNPNYIVAATASVVSFGLMSFIMTAAPMSMVQTGYSVDVAAMGIQWHVLAMFAPSFFTGRLIQRFGKNQITTLGLLIIAVSGVLAMLGVGVTHYWGSLILLGLGWNFGFIGATAMVTDCYKHSERAKTQALTDFLVFGTVAIASFGSGHLLNTAGWFTINLFMLPIVAIVILMLYGLSRYERRVQQV